LSPFLAVVFLLQERPAAEAFPGFHDGFLEGKILKGVEGVMVDENADGALGGEEVGGMFDHPADGILRVGGNRTAGKNGRVHGRTAFKDRSRKGGPASIFSQVVEDFLAFLELFF